MYAASNNDSNLDLKVYDGTSKAYIKLWSITRGHASTSWMQQSLVFDTDTSSDVSTNFKFKKESLAFVICVKFGRPV